MSEQGTANREQSSVRRAVRDFRDLIAWQKSMAVVETTYRLSASFPDQERYGLTSQIRRAAVSIPSNIAEGHGRGPGRAFANHLWIANGSLREVQTQILLAAGLGYSRKDEAEKLVTDCEEVCRILVALRRSVDSG
ncbi:MAG: four helix bundle protein [Planctomycetota bacterium]